MTAHNNKNFFFLVAEAKCYPLAKNSQEGTVKRVSAKDTIAQQPTAGKVETSLKILNRRGNVIMFI